MSATYELIDSTTLTSGSATVAFTSLPQTYRDLVLVTELIGDTAQMGGRIRLNGLNGSTDYGYLAMSANTSSTSVNDSTANGIYMNFSNITTTETTSNIHTFMDYTSSNRKHLLWECNQIYYALMGGWYCVTTSPITSISCEASSDAFGAGSTFFLYGIAG